jgi:hypothetical protein
VSARFRVPQNRADLYLAPVALAVDAWLEHAAYVPAQQLRFDLVLVSNIEPSSRADREKALVEAIREAADVHGWDLSLMPRGLRLAHGEHAVTLGLPKSVQQFLDDEVPS